MADEKHIIEPQRLGLWVAVTFILALLALVVTLVDMNRTNKALVLTQAEILLLHKRIQALQKDVTPPAEPAKPAAEEAKPAP